jgi:hyaluronoglucosaminidase
LHQELGGPVQTDGKIKAGVIEGFFGKPWDWSARLSSIDFLRDYGYQFYIYAPKADPFLRRRWRERMPTETLEQLSQLSSRCRDRGISLGLGLTPFEIYLNYDTKAQVSLRSKLLQINEIGLDVLCILFDDMRGDINELPELQARVISDVCSWSSAQRFIVCPTYYSYDSRLVREFGPPPRGYLRDLGRFIDPEIDIFWTGEKIISDGYSARHLADVASELGRKPFIWDNHISNDSKVRTNYLFLDPSASVWELPTDLVAGLAINPMNQPHLSRIALCGYQRLLRPRGGRGREQIMPESCRSLLEPSLAARLIADSALLQQAGLSQIGDDTRRRLIALYDEEGSNPYAQDVAAWLRGDYEFDPQCLTT